MGVRSHLRLNWVCSEVESGEKPQKTSRWGSSEGPATTQSPRRWELETKKLKFLPVRGFKGVFCSPSCP